jgi:hypothetical protein
VARRIVALGGGAMTSERLRASDRETGSSISRRFERRFTETMDRDRFAGPPR